MADPHAELMGEINRRVLAAQDSSIDHRAEAEAEARRQQDLDRQRAEASVQYGASAVTKAGGHAVNSARSAGSLVLQALKVALPVAVLACGVGYLTTRPK
jgi:hypothetical protein